MDKTKAIRLSVEDELIHEHHKDIEELEANINSISQGEPFYVTITEKRIREIIRDEIKNIEMEKMYND